MNVQYYYFLLGLCAVAGAADKWEQSTSTCSIKSHSGIVILKERSWEQHNNSQVSSTTGERASELYSTLQNTHVVGVHTPRHRFAGGHVTTSIAIRWRGRRGGGVGSTPCFFRTNISPFREPAAKHAIGSVQNRRREGEGSSWQAHEHHPQDIFALGSPPIKSVIVRPCVDRVLFRGAMFYLVWPTCVDSRLELSFQPSLAEKSLPPWPLFVIQSANVLWTRWPPAVWYSGPLQREPSHSTLAVTHSFILFLKLPPPFCFTARSLILKHATIEFDMQCWCEKVHVNLCSPISHIN